MGADHHHQHRVRSSAVRLSSPADRRQARPADPCRGQHRRGGQAMAPLQEQVHSIRMASTGIQVVMPDDVGFRRHGSLDCARHCLMRIRGSAEDGPSIRCSNEPHDGLVLSHRTDSVCTFIWRPIPGIPPSAGRDGSDPARLFNGRGSAPFSPDSYSPGILRGLDADSSLHH